MRDGGMCQIRRARCTCTATCVDHVIDWQDAPWLAFDLGNLRAACRSCNSAQRNTRVAARARAQRDRHPGTQGQYRAW
jgi:hypothetical protein